MRHRFLSASSLALAALLSGCGQESTQPVSVTTSTLSKGLAAWWSFEETGDTARDLSGNGHHLSLHDATRPAGRSGKGLGLSGAVTSFGQCTLVKGLNLDTFTLVTWIQTSASSSHQALVSRESSSGFPSNYRLLLDGPDNLASTYRPGHVSLDGQLSTQSFQAGNVTGSSKAIDDGIWHLVVATGSAKQAKIWIDGKLDTTHTMATAFKADSVAPLDIGRSGYQAAGGYPFRGILDEVRIYSRVLDSSEIQELLR